MSSLSHFFSVCKPSTFHSNFESSRRVGDCPGCMRFGRTREGQQCRIQAQRYARAFSVPGSMIYDPGSPGTPVAHHVLISMLKLLRTNGLHPSKRWGRYG